jgi:Tfp pilus assembly PilM family ATPase
MFASLLGNARGKRGLGRSTDRLVAGVDVGARTIKAIQVAKPVAPGGRPRVVAAHARPRQSDGPLTAGEAAALADALAVAGFAGTRVAVAAGPADTLVGPLELPPRSSGAPLDQLARMELARNFRCPPDSFEMAWWELPAGARGGRGTLALGVGVPHAAADARIDALEAAGLAVDAVDVGPAALLRACGPVLAPAGATAILDLGWGPATLTIAHHGLITFSRQLPDGAVGPLHAGLCRQLGVEPDVADYLLAEVGLQAGPASPDDRGEGGEAVELPDEGRRLIGGFVDVLAKELSLSCSYAANQYPDSGVARVLLVGGGAGTAGLADRLAAVLGVEVTPAAPAGLVECEPGLLSACASPGMTLALGLAMREVA